MGVSECPQSCYSIESSISSISRNKSDDRRKDPVGDMKARDEQ
jgi:hypothetical protein